ncbi:unnamed protein product [Prorocentrum cordatum]|uniref:Uncharacterized protein n=2 Tax=Prorocentrum cordatum TaxID=2364126 RepID=A0ABN9RB47_9DINO|nr:unnamed protein product [Polarella glacialis]
MLGVVYCEVLTAGAADPVREEEEDFCSSSLSRSRLRDADAKKVVHVCCRGAAARRGRGRSGWMPFRSPSAACQPAARGPRAARGRRVGPLMAMPRWFAGEATCAFCMEWCCPEFSRFPTSARSVEEDAEACGRSTSTAPRRARIPGGRGAAVFAPAAPASRGRRARVSMEGAGPWSLPFGRLEFDICKPRAGGAHRQHWFRFFSLYCWCPFHASDTRLFSHWHRGGFRPGVGLAQRFGLHLLLLLIVLLLSFPTIFPTRHGSGVRFFMWPGWPQQAPGVFQGGLNVLRPGMLGPPFRRSGSGCLAGRVGARLCGLFGLPVCSRKPLPFPFPLRSASHSFVGSHAQPRADGPTRDHETEHGNIIIDLLVRHAAAAEAVGPTS